MNDTTKFFKNTLVYSASTILLFASKILILPILTRFLNPSEFGSFDLLNSYSYIFTSLISLGLANGVSRYYFDKGIDRGRLVSGAMNLIAINGIGFLLICIALSPFAASFFLGSQTEWSTFLFYAFAVLCEISQLIPLNLLRLNDKVLAYNLMSIVNFFVYFFTATVLLTLGFKQNGLFIAMATGYIVNYVVCMILNKQKFSFRIKIRLPQGMVAYSLPLVFNGIAIWVFQLSNRGIINIYFDSAEVAMYGMASRISSIIMVLQSAVSLTWSVFALQKYSEDENTEYVSKLFDLVLIAGWILAFFIILFAHEIVVILSTRDYLPSLLLVPVLTIATMLMIWNSFFETGLIIKKKSKTLTLIVIVVALFNLTLTFILVPKLKSFGAAIATLASNLLLVVLKYVFAQREVRIRYNWIRIVTVSTTFMVLILLFGYGGVPFSVRLSTGAVVFGVLGVVVIRYGRRLKLFMLGSNVSV